MLKLRTLILLTIFSSFSYSCGVDWSLEQEKKTTNTMSKKQQIILTKNEMTSFSQIKFKPGTKINLNSKVGINLETKNIIHDETILISFNSKVLLMGKLESLLGNLTSIFVPFNTTLVSVGIQSKDGRRLLSKDLEIKGGTLTIIY